MNKFLNSLVSFYLYVNKNLLFDKTNSNFETFRLCVCLIEYYFVWDINFFPSNLFIQFISYLNQMKHILMKLYGIELKYYLIIYIIYFKY